MQDTIRTTTHTPLLDKLLTKQGNLSDYKFAAILNIPRTTWMNTRLGLRPLSMTVLKAVSRTYPGEFDKDIIEFLRSEDHDSTD